MTDHKTYQESKFIQTLVDKPLKLVSNTAAEKALLTALCQDTHGEHHVFLETIEGGVEDRDFNPMTPWHRQLWHAVVNLQKRDTPITHHTLLRELRKTQTPDTDINYDLMLSELYAQEVDWSLVPSLISELREAGTQRYVQIEALNLAHGAPRLDANVLSSRLSHVSAGAVSKTEHSVSMLKGIDDMRGHYLEAYTRAMEGAGARLKTPVGRINDMWAGGFMPGRYYLLGGRPKSGKTKFATWTIWQLLYNCSAVVDWFSTEMTAQMTWASLLGPSAGINMRAAYELEPSIDDIRLAGTRAQAVSALSQRVSVAMNDLRAIKGELYHCMLGGDVRLSAIEATVKRRLLEMEARSDKRPYMVMVDYLQGVPIDRSTDERDRINEVSMTLNALSKRLSIPVFAIYHTKRDNAYEAHGSSQIEKDGDVNNVILEQDDMPNDHRRLVTAQSRHHAPFSIDLHADLATACFDCKSY